MFGVKLKIELSNELSTVLGNLNQSNDDHV